MSKVCGLHFRNGGKVYYFNTKDLDVHVRDKVIAETSRGKEFGTVVILLDTDVTPLKKKPLDGLLRIATEEDIARDKENTEKENKAFHVCKEKIRKHELEMKLVDAEYTFDKSKLIFYFTADGRVDFRDLVKDLASEFHTRIELRQIGVRDETKTLGGLGVCGRELCCHSYLTEFAPVSIKMAKEQNLSLNPTKISGVCGRLMCCLKNEAETYEYLNRQMPRKGDEIATQDGRVGEVQNVDILTSRVRVMFEDGDTREVIEYQSSDLVFEPGVHKKAKHKPKNPDQNNNKKDSRFEQGGKNDRRDQNGKNDRRDRNDGEKRGQNQGQKNNGGQNSNQNGKNDGERKNRNQNKNNGQNRNQKNDGEQKNAGNGNGGNGNGNGGSGNGNGGNGNKNRNRHRNHKKNNGNGGNGGAGASSENRPVEQTKNTGSEE